MQFNSHLTAFNQPTFKGLPIMQNKGPFALEHLERLYSTIQKAIDDNPRSFAVRIDLRFPRCLDIQDDYESNDSIQRFIDSLKSKIKHSQLRSRQAGHRVHDTKVRYCWAREYGSDGQLHYHFLLLLNRDAYFTLGSTHSNQSNLLNMVQEAWCSALNMDWLDARHAVHIPENACYSIKSSNHSDDQNSPYELFHRASYLCKLETKRLDNGFHSFGCSRV